MVLAQDGLIVLECVVRVLALAFRLKLSVFVVACTGKAT